MSGRTPAIAVVPGGTTVFIGAGNGGVWRSEDIGRTWKSLMEGFDLNPTNATSDSLAIGAIALDPTNPNRLYVGSGEGHGAGYFGVGPIVTDNAMDDSPTWATEPVAPGSSPSLAGQGFYALAVDPADTDRVVGATSTGIFRREPDGAGGFHWEHKSMDGFYQRITSVVSAHSGGVTTFYAAPYYGPVFSSTDGNAWTSVGTGFPNGGDRISLAVQPDNPDVVYALRSDGSVYRLDVSDGEWRLVNGVPAAVDFVTGSSGDSRGWYNLSIAVAPNDVNRIYLGGGAFSSGAALYRGQITVNVNTVTMVPTHIGESVHPDVHALVFAPGEASKLWVGCDGGVFYSTRPLRTGNIFTARNTGLQTLMMNHLGQHPTEDAVLFAGSQDNGGQRYTGEEAWLFSSGGDAGYAVVNWNNPYQILSTYIRGRIRLSLDGGNPNTFTDVNVPLETDANGVLTEGVRFYAPLVGTPPNLGSATAALDSTLVAFGSIRPWISTNIGIGWQSIPSGNLAQDSLNGLIRSLVFASPNRLYAGTEAGGVYRFDRSGANWTPMRIDTLGGANNLPLVGSVTSIAVDPGNSSRVYVTLGGNGDYRHVWFFNGTQWEQRSGATAGGANSLLDIQANVIVVDPANPAHLYVGADIGIWRSTDSGINWDTYSNGLPDAAVVDLVLHNPRRLLRAATHGRSVFERTLPDTPKQGVELYVRNTQLDMGRSPAINNLPDPTAQGQLVKIWRGPDIKLDTPNVNGEYQFPLTGEIDFLQFVDELSDDFQNVATHATDNIRTRVYVQVHNRGVVPADNVRVMLLLANASAGLPALPNGYEVNVRTGMPINNMNWRTVGFAMVDDVRPGFPKVATFNLPSTMLPPPASLAGNQHQCVLALLHHPTDQFTTSQTDVRQLSVDDRKTAHKNLTVVQFTGSAPTPSALTVPVRIHNMYLKEMLLTNLIFRLKGYRGKVCLMVPPLKIEGDLKRQVQGWERSEKSDSFHKWAENHLSDIKRGWKDEHGYDREWTEQREQAVRLAMKANTMYCAETTEKDISINNITMKPGSYHTVFLLLERPPKAKVGQSFEMEIIQTDAQGKSTLGGLDVRVELVPEPKKQKVKALEV